MNRIRRFVFGVCAVALVFVCFSAFAASPVRQAQGRPNFIVIFLDDQGYQDLGCFGSPNIKTPNIDRMAAEGMRFTDFYSADSVCTPSRAALMTGCYPKRVGGLGVLFPRDHHGLNPSETTIPEMLKKSGYKTAMVGKWHLGHLPQFLPTNQGFDSYFGIPYSNDMTIAADMKLAKDILLREGVTTENIWKPKRDWVPLMRNEEVIEYPCDQNTLTKRYTEQAVDFIKKSAKEPFFLYLPHSMPHVPLFASPAFEGKSEAGLYGDCIEEIDWSVGEILKTLTDLKIDKNTMVFYCSDNGPWHFPANATDKVKGNMNRRTGGSALPLRGHKFQQWEGGMREPTIMWWPGRIPAGTECTEVAGTIDVLPTLAALAGAELPEKKIDGKSIVPLIEGRSGAKSPHEAYFYRLEAVRCGDWKLKKGELFNLQSDLSETTDVSKEHPEVVERLKKLLDAYKAEVTVNARPFGGTKVARKPRAQKPRNIKGLKGWKSKGGNWSLDGGVLKQKSANGETAAFAPFVKHKDFTMTVQGKVAKGREGFRLMVRTQNEKNYYRWSVGAFGNTLHSLMAVKDGSPKKRSKPYKAAVKQGVWYELKVVVSGKIIKCYIDDQLVNEESFDSFVAGSVGLGSNQSAVEYKELKVVAPDGKVLLKAL